jgi:hypothetical protein
MKNKRTITIAITVTAIAILAVFGIVRQTMPVQAQDQLPPPVHDRISFGMAGITTGQRMRVNVTNLLPPGPSSELRSEPVRVTMAFRGMNGNLVRNARTGEVIRKVVELESGDSTFLDINYDELLPGAIRAQLRPVVIIRYPEGTVLPAEVAEHKPMVSSMEVISNANGRTDWISASWAMNYARTNGAICETCD